MIFADESKGNSPELRCRESAELKNSTGSVGCFAEFGLGLGSGFLVVGNAVGDADCAIAEGEELRVALSAALVDLAFDEFSVGVDLAVDPHGRGGEEHDVHPLLAVHGDEGLAQHEDVAKEEGADILPGPAVDDLGVDLSFLVAVEIEHAEFAGFSADADFLFPVRGSGALIEEHTVGG